MTEEKLQKLLLFVLMKMIADGEQRMIIQN